MIGEDFSMEEKTRIRKTVLIVVIVCALILVGNLGSYAFFIGQVGQNRDDIFSTRICG